GLCRRRIVGPRRRGGPPIWFRGRHPTSKGMGIKSLGLAGEKPVLGFERAAGHREAFLIEGVFDWLTAVSWNLPAFSTCGTNFPFDRLGWLARARVIFGVLDADSAGDAAAARFASALCRRWVPIQLPDASDLNNIGCRTDGRALFFRLVSAAREQAGVSREGTADETEADD